MLSNDDYVKKRKQRIVYDFWTAPEGVRLVQQRANADRTSLPAGCGVATISDAHLQSMRDLCDTIVNKLDDLVPWGDGWVDKKQRGYGVVPEHSKWKDANAIVEHGILMHDVDSSFTKSKKMKTAAQKKHSYTINKSFTDVALSPDQLEALRTMIEVVKGIVNDPRNAPSLQPYELDSVDLSELVAIQPNIHNGDDYLPLHLDNPRHDGFGVVIVTLALWGSGDVVLVDDGDLPSLQAAAAQEAITLGGCALAPAMQPSRPVVFEGGIVYKDGEFTCTEEHAKVPQESTPAPETSPATTVDSTEASQVNQSADSSTADGTTKVGEDQRQSPDENQELGLDHDQQQGQEEGQERDQEQEQEQEQDHSKSWAFALHPGQLYVLSGPARNKCAHGVVVIPSPAQANTAPASSDTDAAPADTEIKPDITDTSTIAVCAGNSSCVVSAEDVAPGSCVQTAAYVLASMTDNCASNDVDTSGCDISVVTCADVLVDMAGPADVLPATVALSAPYAAPPSPARSSKPGSTHNNSKRGSKRSRDSSGDADSASESTVRNTERARRSADYKKGRVSLNFRFGLHSREQAWADIDSHWG